MNGIKREIKMGREAILKSIKKNKPDFVPLPVIDEALFFEEVNLIETFKSNVELVGGKIKEVNLSNLDSEIKKLFPKAEQIISVSEHCTLGTVAISENTIPQDLAHLDLAIINGEFGVAENGAIWISEKQFIVRALPFITNDLIIVLSKNNICLHMLKAYEEIAQRDRSFGLFISGPSKTADIEQCLVIGAQGAISLTVFLV